MSEPNTIPPKEFEFSGFRKIFWPVHDYELKKVLPMAFMMFCVLFNYTILRDAKDGLVVTAPGSGAETISFLKLYGTLPFAIIMMGIYAKLNTILSKPKLFYTMVCIFITFFALFAYVLFPYKEIVHASPETLISWKKSYPRLQWFLPLIANWTYSLFYIFSELWGTVGLSVLFWQFANDINKVSEAKRFYPLFGLIGNVGLLCSGYMLYAITAKYSHLPPSERWEVSLKWIILALLVCFCFIIYLYRWVRNNVMTDPRLYDASQGSLPGKKKKVKLGFTESLKIVFSSKYLAYLAILVLSYGITINLVEVTWKSQMKLQFPDTAEYVKIMGLFSMTTGFTTIILMIVGANILRNLGWFVGAIITPAVMLITGAMFFSFIVFRDALSGILASISMTPVLMAVIIGWAQNVITKGSKYSLFDPTKEMAYIPLPDDIKTQGKAAVDGVGGRLGKSGGGIIQQILLLTILGSTQITIAPYIGVFLLFISFIWLISVIGLNKEFQKLSNESAQIKKTEKTEKII
ncbi:MAG TPA: Npt1/Npt2 family nucleotide transporter [Candidatus Azosocius sp. HAIN]